ncbi:MAG: zinc ribbon domain-containing protein [Candidatus Hodarchaeales archaeon]
MVNTGKTGSLRGKDICTRCNSFKIIISEPDSKIAANLGAEGDTTSHFLLYICSRCGHTELFLKEKYRKPAWKFYQKKKKDIIEKASMTSCPSCNSTIESGSRFCPNCGSKI